ncbi:MAG TPA: VWA domain-containing protein [Candidatus Sulfotelmatobacter sp.]|nr:VWA domain-containing protein [Candidatus Sulfotelmatobacter sp.]
MMRPSMVFVLLFSTLFLLFVLAHAQKQEQSGLPAGPQSNESEISTKETDAAIKVEVNLVLVPVIVKDSSGEPVSGLKKEDFQLLDNGKPQTISTFSVETAETRASSATSSSETKLPEAKTEKATADLSGPVVRKPLELPRRFVALVFDDSHMKVADAMAVHAATEKLFASLTPTDRVAIYSTQGDIQQDYTGDAAILRKTLANIVPHSSKYEGHYECPNISYHQAELILYQRDQEAIEVAAADARLNNCPTNLEATVIRILQQGDDWTRGTYDSLNDVLRKLASMPGQRVLVYVSPGFLVGNPLQNTNADWIERMVRAGVVVNPIDARGLYTPEGLGEIDAPPQANPDRMTQGCGERCLDYQRIESTYRKQAQFDSGTVLQGMAAGTGGTYFHNRNDLDVELRQALAVPSVTYILGFKPQNTEANGKLHNLKVRVANEKNYSIQARNGYYATKKSADPEEQAKQEVTETLFSREEITGIPVQIKTEFFRKDDTSAQLSVLTRLDARGVKFRKIDGRSCDNVVLATGVFDANGQLIDGKIKEITLKLQDSTLQKMVQTGITVKTVFKVKPGAYIVRSVVRGAEGGQLSSQNLATEIPR